jgi:hypothetical protein
MVKLHTILHSGATTLLDENPEPLVAILWIFRDENVQLAKGRIRHGNHGFLELTGSADKSQTMPGMP